MNYSKHYENLIKKAKGRILEGYGENHHIIPRCFGGSDDKDNIAKLTAREHFIAHLLLYRMQTEKRKIHQMLTAVVMMKGKYSLNSKLYETARKKFSKLHSESISGENNPMKKRGWSDKERDNMSKSKKKLYENKENHPMFGKKHSEKSIQQNRESNSLNIEIFDNNNNKIYECNTGLEYFCDENNLPFKVLKKSCQTNGEYKLYTSFDGSRASPPRNLEWKKYTGWYAKQKL